MMFTCVVFNSSHEPLAVVSAERGLILTLKGEAIILEEVPDRRFRSVKETFPIPRAVVLKEFRKTGSKYYGTAQLNQRNLFVRDNWTCAYCNTHALDLKGKGYLTRDHVRPLSRGGKDEWTNVVASCSKCNHAKDARTPEEAGLTLHRRPKAPTVFEIMMKRSAGKMSRRDRVDALKDSAA